MIIDVFQDIRNRKEFISEVQNHVLNVLYSFQQDAMTQGASIAVDAAHPNMTGAYMELVETGTTQNSRVTVEINSLGEVRILRASSDNDSLGETQSYVTRPLNMSVPPISAATDVLLLLADDHSGFVGTSLGIFLETRASGSASPPKQTCEPLPP